MLFLTPKFWQKQHGAAQLLRPFSWLYLLLSKVSALFIYRRHINVPVICIGNLTIGGSGKTPIVDSFKHYFQDYVILTRGYGGQMRGPVWVDLQHHQACDVGDEALILARNAPVVVCQNRYQGAMFALKTSVRPLRLFVLDDGFQNKHLYYNHAVVVVDGRYGFGNGYLFPAGPLRERVQSGLSRADAMIVMNKDALNLKTTFSPSLPIFSAQVVADIPKDLKQKKIVAFAGIAHPAKFHDMLVQHCLNVCQFFPFPDHYMYQDHDLQKICQAARMQDATLVTTRKDFVRIPSKYQSNIQIIDIEIEFQRRQQWHHFLTELLHAKV